MPRERQGYSNGDLYIYMNEHWRYTNLFYMYTCVIFVETHEMDFFAEGASKDSVNNRLSRERVAGERERGYRTLSYAIYLHGGGLPTSPQTYTAVPCPCMFSYQEFLT